jgi:uncharacterized protein YfiM (DUF2279 family)
MVLMTGTATWAQQDSTEVNKKRLRTLAIGGGAAYTASMAGLHVLWYQNNDRQSWRWFNDNREWKQMDKAGHFFSGYQLSHLGSKAFEWTGLPEQKAHLWGSLTGILLLAPIEWLDGYSTGYGASWGDLVANTSGAAFFYGQQALWREIRIHPKFSFSPSPYASLRPELLGHNHLQQVLKDYNGQTYWLSFDLYKFLGGEKSTFPKWLNLAVGYSANEMVFARDHQNREAGYFPYRQTFLALDLDLSHIRSRSPWVNSGIFILNMIKIPAPTIEWNKHGINFHFLHF